MLIIWRSLWGIAMNSRQIILIAIAFGLTGCGGSSSESLSPTNQYAAVNQQQLQLQVPSLYQQNTLTVTQGATVVSGQTSVDSAAGAYTVSIASQLIRCPMPSGCGSKASWPQADDFNGNGIVDLNEPWLRAPLFSLQGSTVPGKQFVALSHVLSSMTEQQRVAWLMIGQPMLAAEPGMMSALTALDYGYFQVIGNQSLYPTWAELSTEKQQQITSTALTWLQSQASDDSVMARGILARLVVVPSFEQPMATISDLESFLDVWRDLTALLQISQGAEQPYYQSLDEWANSIDTDLAQQQASDLADLLNTVVSQYNPSESTASGIYPLGEYSLEYKTNPNYQWHITGTYQTVPVDVSLSATEWRSSASLGDKLVASASGSYGVTGSLLSLDVNPIRIEFDGVDDVFNQPKAKSYRATVKANINLQQRDTAVSGALQVNRRLVGSNDNLQPINDFIQLVANAQSAEHSALLAISQFPETSALGAAVTGHTLMQLDLAGAPNARLLIEQQSDSFRCYLNGQLLMVTVDNIDNPKQLKITSGNGYWLTLNQSKGVFGGQVGFGEQQLAKIIEVRNVPGVLLSDGRFISIL